MIASNAPPASASHRWTVAASPWEPASTLMFSCLIRVLCATLICALESVHGLPVYLVVLIMGVVSFFIDVRVPSPTHPENALAPRPLLHAIAY